MRIMDLNYDGLTFTRRWFVNRNLETFRTHVHPQFVGKPTLYLELGVFEGQSMCFMLQHVLTHPQSRAVGIDPWLQTTKLDAETMNGVRLRAFGNTTHAARTKPAGWPKDETWPGRPDRCVLLQANSAEALRRMVSKDGFCGVRLGNVDVCMVDGNHNALAVLDDCRLVWKLLKPGGWMLLDDVENQIPKTAHVKEGLAMFLAECKEAKQVWKHKFMECYVHS